ncbi:MAG: acetoacetate--CoA ligase [Geminicoccaceae bacterium]|nr:acetoacetate--CoA ligase [Geminicoccaceae bacterium]MCX8102219.1 acetoacetate--CoA ligase [Geminicoccaceae bacterium]MDW8370695.1 acetoacetate--CoA ligase [Geminicoccaceae bacterium]
MNEPVWRPDPERAARTQMAGFAADHGFTGPDAVAALWRWSVDHPERFWQEVWTRFGVVASEAAERVLDDPEAMPGARWFPGARLNFAQNLLRRRDAEPAIVFVGEDGRRRELSWSELWEAVERLAAALRARGIGLDDRVVGYLPNIPETIVGMLATSAIGAIWSSCSPDFGVRGVLDRFGQIEPKAMLTVDGYLYAGKRIDIRAKVGEVASALPSLKQVVVVPFLDERSELAPIPRAVSLADFLARDPEPLRFEQLPFDYPLYVLYSSGTTGMPKAIVHGQGGTLLQHLKEHRLHCDLRPGERLFYYTTCGWMMWNWLASGLASGATLVLYDGSPFHPGPAVLWDLAQSERITIFGTSAKYLQALEKAGAAPIDSHDLSELKAILSTGSPLLPESFDYVYSKIKKDVHLASISGGTDIVSCFVLGNPAGPVWRGEIQMRGLGMAVDVFDEQGRPVRGRRGELVCTKPFPSMPIGFWNDPDGSRYRRSYFERFPGIWCHGDWAELTEHDGIVIYGRSDAVLNPGGVRIGTAEIYRQVEQIDEVLESVCVGQEWDGDTRVVLFVKLREGLVLDDALRERIRRRIRENTTPRHVPAKIVQVADIPRTMSGKITELAVRDVIHGRPVANVEALANPQALELFRDLPELRS